MERAGSAGSAQEAVTEKNKSEVGRGQWFRVLAALEFNSQHTRQVTTAPEDATPSWPPSFVVSEHTLTHRCTKNTIILFKNKSQGTQGSMGRKRSR